MVRKIKLLLSLLILLITVSACGKSDNTVTVSDNNTYKIEYESSDAVVDNRVPSSADVMETVDTYWDSCRDRMTDNTSC